MCMYISILTHFIQSNCNLSTPLQISPKYCPPLLKSIVYREKEQIIIKCLNDSVSGNIFVYIFIDRRRLLTLVRLKFTCLKLSFVDVNVNVAHALFDINNTKSGLG